MDVNDIEWFSRDEKLSFDVRRSIILGHYMHEWGMPEYRVITSKSSRKTYVEIYYFPAGKRSDVSRFATIGLSTALRPSGSPVSAEWMLALTSDLGGESSDRIFGYIVDLIAHHIENAKNSITPIVMPESEIAPDKWSTKALLIDELRGESEKLDDIKVGVESVPVLWLIPISKKEVDIISNEGIEKFDEIIEGASYSIVDPRRP
ncbi:suppressor of fused domain protein [Acidovorax sp. SUPP2522]|uniref:suppressor of fused domain protein n=1 Tax=unclassified Acidovorax TaxID=2684926 RepID=UPI0023495104|nr:MULTISPECIES: suppressor of fused domain protein [unclassified Acidovorax]WCM98910.1 suppressor of fused domain protein [Acidovorax sp. GBBC 1281]GKT19635.1 suppressor of fused domain protein [Acidovorax sp. SUPP2522]